MVESLLSIQETILAYDDVTVIDKLSLQIKPGSFIGLIGPNGAGKTTLMLALSGQFQPQNGQILFQDRDIYKHNYFYKQHTGYVHEMPFFYPHLTIEEFLWFVARVKHMPKKEIADKIDHMLQTVRLYDERQKLTSQLSQGMRKKLAIAGGMINSPQIVFLDEALNGVDVESAFHIKNYLAEYVQSGGTVILSTHALEVIEKLCNRYIILKRGKIIADLDEQSLEDLDENEPLESLIMRLLDS
jgi:ABC-2 type transport system ATP-binding protein